MLSGEVYKFFPLGWDQNKFTSTPFQGKNGIYFLSIPYHAEREGMEIPSPVDREGMDIPSLVVREGMDIPSWVVREGMDFFST